MSGWTATVKSQNIPPGQNFKVDSGWGLYRNNCSILPWTPTPGHPHGPLLPISTWLNPKLSSAESGLGGGEVPLDSDCLSLTLFKTGAMEPRWWGGGVSEIKPQESRSNTADFAASAGVWATPCYTWRQNVGYLLRYSTSETAAIKLGLAKTAKPDQKCVPGVCRLATSRSNFRVVLFSSSVSVNAFILLLLHTVDTARFYLFLWAVWCNCASVHRTPPKRSQSYQNCYF